MQIFQSLLRTLLPVSGLILIVFSLFISGSGASEIRLEGSGDKISRSYFGMHIHRADTTTPWPIARFGTWRLWDAAVSWERLEPAQDSWDFKRLDTLVALAERHGIEPMLTLGITPRWAASRPNEKFVYGYGGNSPPRDMRDWEDYVRTVTTRYKGRIQYYELWNEPTFDEIDKGRGFYAGSVKTMVELGRIAHRVIKEIDPNNKLISPGFTDQGGRLDLYLSNGGKSITDVVAHHCYPQKPERITACLDFVRGVMTKHGIDGLPLWNTETGFWLPLAGETPNPNWPKNQNELSGYIARTLILGAVSGLDRFYWYSWETTMLGGNPKSLQASPSIVAYMQTMRWLDGASINHCFSKDHSLWICELQRGPRRANLVWNSRESVMWVPPLDWNAIQFETLDARSVQIKSGEALSIGQVPVLVKRDHQFWTTTQTRP
ncbi:MAG: beta-galactosidase [Thiobacillus sp.]|uniref:GH39 family glycosyl hydrolase n=1 Tax=Thiobacillus sp. TaxID=924 RepID=UPI00273668B5|nr:endo-1,4-beta-xylanase [Thiobacillus sp.]MDP3584440.1 beta-galactosidase [Thiobacillus sp.]